MAIKTFKDLVRIVKAMRKEITPLNDAYVPFHVAKVDTVAANMIATTLKDTLGIDLVFSQINTAQYSAVLPKEWYLTKDIFVTVYFEGNTSSYISAFTSYASGSGIAPEDETFNLRITGYSSSGTLNEGALSKFKVKLEVFDKV